MYTRFLLDEIRDEFVEIRDHFNPDEFVAKTVFRCISSQFRCEVAISAKHDEITPNSQRIRFSINPPLDAQNLTLEVPGPI